MHPPVHPPLPLNLVEVFAAVMCPGSESNRPSLSLLPHHRNRRFTYVHRVHSSQSSCLRGENCVCTLSLAQFCKQSQRWIEIVKEREPHNFLRVPHPRSFDPDSRLPRPLRWLRLIGQIRLPPNRIWAITLARQTPRPAASAIRLCTVYADCKVNGRVKSTFQLQNGHSLSKRVQLPWAISIRPNR